MEVGRGKRVLAYLVNSIFGLYSTGNNISTGNNDAFNSTGLSNISQIFLILGLVMWVINIITILNRQQTIGGIVMGYKWVSTEDDSSNIKYGRMIGFSFLYALICVFTLGIFWIIDVATMTNRNGTYFENWSKIKKVLVNKEQTTVE